MRVFRTSRQLNPQGKRLSSAESFRKLIPFIIMLTITISKSPKDATNYYDEALVNSDNQYYKTEKVKSYFEGKTAKLLGITGEVARDAFSSLANGVHPKTGERLTVRKVSNARAGYDYTFSSVKSASIAYAITKDPAILKAHQEAVQMAMKEVEASMQTKTNISGKTVYQTTGNCIYSRFDHFTSRATKDKESDLYLSSMQIHSHCFVFNTTYNHSKQRFQAIEEGNLRRQAPYFEAIYHSYFSKYLVEAGYDIVQTKDRWEIKDLSNRKLIEKFSERSLQINELAKLKGITDPSQKAALGALSRVKKGIGISEAELFDYWMARLSPKELQAIQNAKKNRKGTTEAISADEAIQKSLNHFLERASTIPEKRVLGHALSLGYGSLTVTDVQEALEKRSDIFSANVNTIKYITTKEIVQAESEIIQFASYTKGTQVPLNQHYQIQNPILNKQQKNAIKYLLNSKNQVNLLFGSAGVGKTTLLKSVQKAILENGKKIYACAPSAEATKVLREKGFEQANTLSGVLVNTKVQDELSNSTLLVDEAGQISTVEMRALFQLSKDKNIRLILSGDPAQHQSILAGDSLKMLMERSKLPLVHVNQIVRQSKNEPYRKAIQDMVLGNTLKGYNRLDKLGAIQEIEDDQERYESLADAYLESIKQRRSSIIIAPVHEEGQKVTEIVRDRLKAKGQLKGEERIYETQKALSMTEEEKQSPINYEEGMIVQYHQNAKGGFVAGQKFEVHKISENGAIELRSLHDGEKKKLDYSHHERFNTYQKTQTPLLENDLVRISNNGKTIENTKINNGQVFQVRGFDDIGNIELSNGKTLSKDYRNFSLGYYNTSYASQSRDAQDLFIAQSTTSLAATNDRQFYVSTSRGIENISIYTDDKIELNKAIQRNSDRISALEIAEKQQEQELWTKRRNYHEQLRMNPFKDERTVSKAYGEEKLKFERGINEAEK